MSEDFPESSDEQELLDEFSQNDDNSTESLLVELDADESTENDDTILFDPEAKQSLQSEEEIPCIRMDFQIPESIAQDLDVESDTSDQLDITNFTSNEFGNFVVDEIEAEDDSTKDDLEISLQAEELGLDQLIDGKDSENVAEEDDSLAESFEVDETDAAQSDADVIPEFLDIGEVEHALELSNIAAELTLTE